MILTLITLPVALALTALANPLPLAPPGTSPASLQAVPGVTVQNLVPEATIPLLYLCDATNCGASCTAIALSDVGYGNCFWGPEFISVELVDPSYVFPGNAVDVAPNNCTNWLALPQQGVCYNIISSVLPWHQFGTYRV
ncbi:hypothetical protein L226DRAFT_87559 [Lentinus tigrinus ALCF2SS1-7]|uniref:uncharacterized protein n=1 Tax=Lentinus tigrinus ALCF2SS1-7 TaxID=1328758 RepID=UPI001165D491|nr:hypothetical protein L226DRAFT_87559 [Lentinus tigrinus ALCF2SS1-7]